MSEENVVVVRRYYEAAERTFAAYWEDPRSAVEAVKSGEIGPEAAEGLRYLHPNAEWKTALTGVTFRGYNGMAEGFDQLVDAAGTYRVELQEVTDLGGTVLEVPLDATEFLVGHLSQAEDHALHVGCCFG